MPGTVSHAAQLHRIAEEEIGRRTLRVLLDARPLARIARGLVVSSWRAERGRLLREHLEEVLLHISRFELAVSARLIAPAEAREVAEQGLRFIESENVAAYLVATNRKEVLERLSSRLRLLPGGAPDRFVPRALYSAILSFDRTVRKNAAIRTLTSFLTEMELAKEYDTASRTESLALTAYELLDGRRRDLLLAPFRSPPPERSTFPDNSVPVGAFDLVAILDELQHLRAESRRFGLEERVLDHYGQMCRFLGRRLRKAIALSTDMLTNERSRLARVLEVESILHARLSIDRLAVRALLVGDLPSNPPPATLSSRAGHRDDRVH